MNIPSAARRPRALLFALLFALTCKGFYDVGFAYEDYRLPQIGVRAIPEGELVFYAWFALFGLLAGVFAFAALAQFDLEPLARRIIDSVVAEPRRAALALSLIAFAESFAFRRFCLLSQPIADDEATYLFIARTLLRGRLTNPPPADPDYFRNQFVVLNEHAWHGKYPIGHPLWLAIGEAVHLRDLMSPLAGAITVGLCFAIGRRFFSERRALFGSALLCLSPHFVWTHATLLSQPTSTMVLALGCFLLLRARETERLLFAGLAGVAFGFGVLVRPLPGALFAAVAALAYVWPLLRAAPIERRALALRCACYLVGCALVSAIVLWVNRVQGGSPFTSGYHEIHGRVRLFQNGHNDIANSLFGGLLRENFWLFGVPLSLIPVCFARPRERFLFWGLIAAELAYRVIAPKTVVSTTGPIYLTEAVPLLALAAADGVIAIAAFTRERWRGSVLTLMAAGAAVALAMFIPVELEPIRVGAELRSLVFRALEENHADRALVFCDALIYPESGRSWAYYPDNPSPSLDDDVLFVRIPTGDVARELHDFWQRRFKDRRAFLFMWGPKGEPLFRELQPNE